MKQQDNPFARGLSVNEDVICDDFSDSVKSRITDRRNKKKTEYTDMINSAYCDSRGAQIAEEIKRAEWQDSIDEGKVSVVYNGPPIDPPSEGPHFYEQEIRSFGVDANEALDFLFKRLCESMRHVHQLIHAERNYRSGLALTNPEE